MNIYNGTCTPIYIHYTCSHISVQICKTAHTHTHTNIYIYIYLYIYIYTANTCTHARTHAHTHTHTHIYIHLPLKKVLIFVQNRLEKLIFVFIDQSTHSFGTCSVFNFLGFYRWLYFELLFKCWRTKNQYKKSFPS